MRLSTITVVTTEKTMILCIQQIRMAGWFRVVLLLYVGTDVLGNYAQRILETLLRTASIG